MNNRILLLNTELSGVNRHLLSNLSKKGWELAIIDIPFPRICDWRALISTFRFNKTAWSKKFYQERERLYKSPWTFLQRTALCQKKIKKINCGFDIIFQISGMFSPCIDYTHLDRPYVTYNDYTMKLAEREYRPWAPFKSRREAEDWYTLESKLYQNAARVLTFSNRTRRSVIDDYGVLENKVVAVGSGVNFDTISSKPREGYSNRTILFVGIDFVRKGGPVLLESFKTVKKEISDAKLIIVGPGNLKIDIEGVEVIGHIDDRLKLQQLYAEASIFVLPSIADPFPNSLFEAMSYRLPCVSTDASGIQEQIQDGVTGYIVPVNNVERLKEKMVHLLKNPSLMEQMGNAGRKRVEENFTWVKVIEKIDFHLRQVINSVTQTKE